MCREISLMELGPRARMELEAMCRETGIRVVDGGSVDEPDKVIPSPRKKPTMKVAVVNVEREEVKLILTGMFNKKTGKKKR